jgi:8-oxo-dGTP diphosphatase
MQNKESEPVSKKVVAAVIYNSDRDSILAGQRVKGKRFELKWELIGGKVERKEKINKAVVREVEEEIGLIVEAVGFIEKKDYDYGLDIGVVEVNFIECQPVEEVNLNGFDRSILNDVRWVKITDLSDLDWIEADKGFVAKLAKSNLTQES